MGETLWIAATTTTILAWYHIHGWGAVEFVMALTTQEIPFSGRNKFNMKYFFYHGATTLSGQGLLVIEDSLSHSVIHTRIDRTPLDEWSARRRGLYLTTHNTHKRQTSTPPAEFELTIPASERPQTHALDRAVTGIS